MTDKQIIIDGCDVSGCSFFDIHYLEDEDVEIKNFCRFVHCDCDSYPNCYYKQLKRKEQELEEVCKSFDIEYAIDEETGNLFGRCNKLYKKEQECEDLREDIKDIANLLDLDTGEEYSFGNIEMEIKELKAENDKLKQTLTEIKEIAEKTKKRYL